MTRPYAQWANHTSLFQWRRPALWTFLILLVFSGMLTIAEQAFFLSRVPSGLVLSWILLAAYLLPMAMLLYRLDLYEREPLSLVLAALLWGALAATTLAGLANQGWGSVVIHVGGADFAVRWSAALTAPLVEEILKGAGIVLLFQIAGEEFDDVLDGFVYGAMTGLGFAVVEDVFYFVVVFGGSVPGVIAGFFLRVVASGLYGHVLYSGLVGMAIASRRLLPGAGIFAIAVTAHFLWNAPIVDFGDPQTAGDLLRIPLILAMKGMPLLIVVGVAVALSRARQGRVFRELITPEVGGAGVTQDELRVLCSSRERRRAVRSMRRRSGRRAARLLRRLHREQCRLGVMRSRDTPDTHEAVAAQRNLCFALRGEIETTASTGGRFGLRPPGGASHQMRR